jgi:hypothetical protein
LAPETSPEIVTGSPAVEGLGEAWIVTEPAAGAAAAGNGETGAANG